MHYVEAACSISCFSFMPLQMLMVLMLNRSSYTKHSILLKDKHTFLDKEGIRLQIGFIGEGPPVSHYNIVDVRLLHPYSVTLNCCSVCTSLP